MRTAFVTGTAGFIGFHMADLLLSEGFRVHGYDGMTDYYDVTLKQTRHRLLAKYPLFTPIEARLEDQGRVAATIKECKPEIVIHLAAQAGVRHSLDHPKTYLDSNIVGTFNILEACADVGVRHLLVASTSSVYGANPELPQRETSRADLQVSFYAASKKACEAMAHSFAYTTGMPITMLRFFTVYGPWGRPDMAGMIFSKAILEGTPINLFNRGAMHRDFTYVSDTVRAVRLLADQVPPTEKGSGAMPSDSLSPVAPFRVVNIGNSRCIKLGEFIETLEAELGKKAIRRNLEMQPGDVAATHSDSTLLESLTGFKPKTSLRQGVAKFAEWYLEWSGESR